MIRTIPLDKLVRSPRNVRGSSDEQADRQLKADIEARGLLQNLVVTSLRKPRGSYAVEAGDRRLRALQALAAEGKLRADADVSCLILDGGAPAAREASLAENVQRLRMNPADECVAFGRLVEEGCDAEGIARRFGLTVRFVEGRLRLAALAPPVFAALGAGEISLDVAQAYAATGDQERQAYVFEQLAGSYSGNHPDSIRRMILQASVSGTDRRARYVGEEAYAGAGGRIERDLFSGEDAARWLDVPLLDRLAGEKLAAEAEARREELGLAFVRPTLDRWIGSSQLEGLSRLALQPAPLTDEDTARLEQLGAELDDLAAVIDGEDAGEDERRSAEERTAEVEAEVREIRCRPPRLDDTLRGSAGAFLMLDEAGRPFVDPAFYAEGEDADPTGAAGAGGSEAEDGSAGADSAAPALSRRLLDELAMQRRDILAVHVAADPGFALDLAIFLLADRLNPARYEQRGSTLAAPRPAEPASGFAAPDSAAAIARAEAAAALDRGWTAQPSLAERFDGFRQLPEESRAAWLGEVVAGSLEAVDARRGEAFGFADHLGRLLGIAVASWWRPTGLNFFDRVPKAVTLAALADVGGPAFAQRYASAKRTELAQSCERIFAGDFIAEPDVKAAALAWVPEAMLFAGPAQDQGEAPAADDEGQAAAPPDQAAAA